MGKAAESKKCKFCGQIFFKPKRCGRKKWNQRQFCSKGCVTRYRGGRFEEKFCLYCGIKMKPRDNQSPVSFNRQKFCSRSCGSKFTRNGVFKPGDQHRLWRGGQCLSSNGYRLLLVSIGKYEPEHRIEMEKHIGRKLRKEEIVHHVNRNRLDNRIENLEIMTPGEHSRLHMTGFKVSAETIEKLKKIRAGTNQKECHQQWKSEITEESIRQALGKYKTQKEAAAYFGIDKGTLMARLKYYQNQEVVK